MLDKLPHYCPVCAYHEVGGCAVGWMAGAFRSVLVAATPSPNPPTPNAAHGSDA